MISRQKLREIPILTRILILFQIHSPLTSTQRGRSQDDTGETPSTNRAGQAAVSTSVTRQVADDLRHKVTLLKYKTKERRKEFNMKQTLTSQISLEKYNLFHHFHCS